MAVRWTGITVADLPALPGEVKLVYARGARKTHRTETYHLKTETRDYEAEFAQALRLLGYQVLDPPAWRKCKALHADPCVVVSQYAPRPISQTDGRIRNWKCDFASPLYKVALEIDGFSGGGGADSYGGGKLGGHRSWGGFHRDREKQRDLSFQGWRTLRYGPGDLATWADVLRCADEFVRFLALVKEGL